MSNRVSIKVRAPKRVAAAGPLGLLRVEPLGRVQDREALSTELRGTKTVTMNESVAEYSLPNGQYLASMRTPSGKVLRTVFDVTSDTQVVLGEERSSPSSRRSYAAPGLGGGTRRRAADSQAASYVAREYEGGSRRVSNSFIALASDPISEPARRSVVPVGPLPPKLVSESLVGYSPRSDDAFYLSHFSALTERFFVTERYAGERQSNDRRLPAGWSKRWVRAFLGLPVASEPLTPAGASVGVLKANLGKSTFITHEFAHYVALLGQASSDAPTYWVARLPGEWRELRTMTPSVVSVSVRNEKGRQPRLSVSISDPDIQSIHGFMRQGDLEGALAILDDCIPILAHKNENRYAAAAAGYVLLNAPPGRIQSPWEEWVGNLGSWFHDLPDGLIQHATLLLQSDLTFGRYDYFPIEQDRRADKACELLLKSMSRGLPLYQAGLKLLVANLRIVINQEREDAADLKSAYELATWLHMRVDPAEVFTIVDVADAIEF